ncbi:hypothetical protein SISSUDRAFT_1061272 [Sistotremastrum suecicum HHB10207 ss-3]|uniref:BTB domain-containing protein n=1 Tax=Sistotremastrum suecicum HHB10207 ss-3 TaxID=1314776 RepID=A0A166E9F8_9AGAM|nr:hypothetical protein SISSUDRAFT_1061272 [Sistotremastrum suecicum HHB10207 ss-3]
MQGSIFPVRRARLPEYTLLTFPDGDLIVKSSDKKEFRVHKKFLCLASEIFTGMISLDDVNPSVPLESTRPATVDVTESSFIMNALLRYIYPVERPRFSALDQIVAVMMAADKYLMGHVMKDLEDVLLGSTYLEADGLRVYMLAHHFSLKKLEDASLKHAVRKDVLSLRPEQIATAEITHFSLEAYYRLRFFAWKRAMRCETLIEEELFATPTGKICECITASRESDSEYLAEQPEGDWGGDIYVSDDENETSRTCEAVVNFRLLAYEALMEDCGTDVFRNDLMLKAAKSSKCRDSLRTLFEDRDQKITKIRWKMDKIPWEFEKEYLEAKKCNATII